MNNSYYKYCIVPECKNTTLKTPDKLFIYVPNNKKVRKQWLTLAGRSDADDLSTVSRMYFCEDHFDLPNDMVNYMEYYIMGKVSQVRLKAGCTPKKFVCQGDGRKRTGSTKRTNKKAKKQKTIAECPDESKQEVRTDIIKVEVEVEVEEISCEQTADVTNGTAVEQNTRDKAVQTELELRPTTDLNVEKKIENNPQLHIGAPIRFYYLIDIIKNELNIPKHHLLLCLNKIRLNCKAKRLTDDYGMSPSCISELLFGKIPLIATMLQPFIVAIDRDIKRTVPLPFRQKCNNISCIIQCLEIDIQKPLKTTHQAQTWSNSKKAYTVKYLISCTPNGLVNYISPGFGGGTTDTRLVELCDFPKKLKSGTCIMADKGFENLEQYLNKSSVTLVRAPSGTTVCKSEGIISKQIANLRTYVERVQRCLIEFRMLKPRTGLHFKYVKILDDIVTIACAFINLQCELYDSYLSKVVTLSLNNASTDD
ncbi:uncharacterized protein [Choristoneura fumiferana]|uniref:uncharacterized protein n=1 Tax=Choristoneura fumiferana TaxID=7141 RepID=UPI003D15660A